MENLENEASNFDQYKRKWNLRLKGLKEDKEEDTRQTVMNIVEKIQPSWKEKVEIILDSVQRIGPTNSNHPRQIIIQFTSRAYRDELWRTIKQHPTCRELNIRFAEDLTRRTVNHVLLCGLKSNKQEKPGWKIPLITP